MTTLDTRPRADVLRPLTLGSSAGRRPGLKMAMARLPAGQPIVLRILLIVPGTRGRGTPRTYQVTTVTVGHSRHVGARLAKFRSRCARPRTRGRAAGRLPAG